MSKSTTGVNSLLLASQPIFDGHDAIHGVELLYRSDTGLGALDVGDEVATAEVVYHLNTAIMQRISFSKVPTFINVSAALLLSPHFLPVSPDQVVIELVERTTPDQALIDAVRCLHNQGYRFALDDFNFTPEWAPLLELSSYLKVDISSVEASKVARHKQRLSHLDLKWIAERVETREERDAYRQMGFELFQGYYYARPQPVYGKKLPATTLYATQLLKTLRHSEPSIDAIIALIQADPELAIKLTRIANSAYFNQHAPISSLRDVVARIGFQQLSSWAALFGLLGSASSAHSELALTRAKACELLAKRDGLNGQDAYFIGLLSSAELLLGIPGEEFLTSLGLDSSTMAATLGREGPYGKVLQRIEITEKCLAMREWSSESEDLRLFNIYQQAHQDALALLTTLSTSQ
ncbi:EAL and modified HD-GYP domain-containing signal transduction protein [Franzmannia pantelleriensis]|uniref:EAL and modified HD-GYP domain-containing signal transduction protein n=1 Tax=Franzmannia pantelleriensis TaxID=48727 RepID=A0A1G9M2J7_9GAMM|nr:HDOD domain-containing protein [Halomonas pantelleriensis]SDL68428.1 EAL and modified HD-GYP domain-containing signal transduction protein [Halomonas pantelleriensis]